MASLATLAAAHCGRRLSALKAAASMAALGSGTATTTMMMPSSSSMLLSRSSVAFLSTSSSSSSSGISALCSRLDADLAAMKEAGTFKTETVMSSPQGPVVTVVGADDAQDPTRQSKALNFCSNNYLGFSNHPRLAAAARASLDEFGFGLSSVRFICGTQTAHRELEKRIAEMHGADDAILYPSCFDANAGLFEAILTADDAIVSDELNHASIIDGVRLCKAKRFRFKHADVSDLKEKLAEAKAAGSRNILVATDGVFSMDGEVAPLPDIKKACDEFGAVLFVDECHATGVLGERLRGTDEYFGVHGKCWDIVNSTLGKALGGATGGYTAGPASIITTLRQKARPYLFSNSVSPAVVAASHAALDLLEESAPELSSKLQSNARRFRDGMTGAGFALGGVDHPIVPVMVGDARGAAELAAACRRRGLFVVAFSYPVVPKGKARVRVQLSAAHTAEMVDEAVATFKEAAKEVGVL